jgi:hypothetical protein
MALLPALLLELDGGPAFLGQHRPRQAIHIQREVVNAPQINVRGDRTVLQNLQEVFGLGFQNDHVPNQTQRLVFDGGQPADLGLALFELGDCASEHSGNSARFNSSLASPFFCGISAGSFATRCQRALFSSNFVPMRVSMA